MDDHPYLDDDGRKEALWRTLAGDTIELVCPIPPRYNPPFRDLPFDLLHGIPSEELLDLLTASMAAVGYPGAGRPFFVTRDTWAWVLYICGRVTPCVFSMVGARPTFYETLVTDTIVSSVKPTSMVYCVEK